MYSLKLQMLGDDPTARKTRPSLLENNTSGSMPSPIVAHGSLSSGNLQSTKVDSKGQTSSHGLQKKDAPSGSDFQHINQSSLAIFRKNLVHARVSISFFLFS